MAELSKELLKNVNRDKDNEREIFEETADVYVLLEYIKKIYGFSDKELWEYTNEKIARKRLPDIEKWKKEAEENK